MRRVILLCGLSLLAAAAPASAAQWRSQQPVADGIGVPANIGEVGDIEFQAPNRGVLITAGNGGIPAGIFAYDGSGWYRYATVCGGHEGRIAWAGPTEFWTISDQQLGQETGKEAATHISLCHFKNGAVVASYAEPLGLPGSYLPMDAAACSGPDDCWFAGERLPGTVNEGAFHLHWNGSSLTPVPSLSEVQPQLEDPGRSVTGLAYYGGRFYEGVKVAEGDFAPSESPAQPFFLHQITSAGATRPFLPSVVSPAVDYGTGATPEQLEGFQLSGVDAALWAAAGAKSAPAKLTVLRKLGSAAFAQVPLGAGVLGAGDGLTGIAAEAGGQAAWIAFRRAGEFEAAGPARLVQVHADGSVGAEITLPANGEGISAKGTAGPVACPASEQCWMATAAGWLFHLGPDLPRDEAPAMHTMIDFRPPDNSLPTVPPISLPEDDSGASGSAFEYHPNEGGKAQAAGQRRAPKLLVGLHQRVLAGSVLELSFTLKAKAQVRLLARRSGQVVAKTDHGYRPPAAATAPRSEALAEQARPASPRREEGELEVRAAERRRLLLAFALLAVALVIVALLARPSGAGAQGGGELAAQPAFGAPAATFLGASPQEAGGEVWAIAKGNARDRLARYADASGWETLPPPVAGDGQPIADLELAEGPSAGRTTPAGGVVVAARVEEGLRQLLVVRDPGGGFHETADPSSALNPGEALFGSAGLSARLLAAFEGPAGHTGAFVVPSGHKAVLAFDGSEWEREEICIGTGPGACVEPPASFRVLGIDASGDEAWLLAKNALEGEGIELFEREPGSGEAGEWRQRSLGATGSLGSLFGPSPPAGVEVASRGDGQPLTVTTAGVWVDTQLTSGAESNDATIYFDDDAGKVVASWCDLPSPAGLCTNALGAELPTAQNRSFAWPPDGSSGPYGRRTVTGVGQGAMLNLEGTVFTRIQLAGGAAGSGQGAALSAPDQGWLGAEPPLRLTRTPEAGGLQPWPVTFRHPLTAIAAQPGSEAGALGAEALAVGDNGQVAHYMPEKGWEPESLLTGSGKRAKPTLRGVAWPENGRAYAVGDGAAMWVWQRATNLWAPDPAKPPNLARANFTGIAFQPGSSSRGYAVGKQGLLLGYGRLWTQEALPAGVPAEANFTSIAFAGSEALATYKLPVGSSGGAHYSGGVLVNDGSGWRVEAAAEAALDGAVPQRVAGLPDGGAVIASSGEDAGGPWVIERSGPGGSWQEAPGGALGYPAALAAIREGSEVRAIVSVALGESAKDLNTDLEQVFNQPAPGQPPLLTSSYELPGSGIVARQTATGWRDEQHEDFPLPTAVPGQTTYDLPQRPDWVLALLISPNGSQGWAVGGETGTFIQFQGEAAQTAGVMRYGSQAAAPANVSISPIATEPGVSFALGGGAQCAGPCADLGGSGIGPDRWLKAAVGRASGIAGLRAFLYTGASVADGAGASLSELAFAREEAAYARRLGSSAGALPVFAAAASSDLDSGGSSAAFLAAFNGFGAPLGLAAPGAGVTPLSQTAAGKVYYSFNSAGGQGNVRVIVLDYSADSLGAPQSCWLAQQLGDARAASTAAIVVGGRDLAGQAADAAADASQVVRILTGATVPAGCPGVPLAGSASAYFFEFPEQNRQYQLTSGRRSIPAYGSGTLGYVQPQRRTETDFVGAGGFLLTSVKAAERDPATNIAPVKVRLIPNIGALALEPTDGTLVRRSHVALFNGLARRPIAGVRCRGGNAPLACDDVSPDPYVPIPSECHGGRCASGVFPDYTFSSSDPDIADFVSRDPNSLNPRSVLLVKEKPVLDTHSGLLCGFNEGTTTVTVSTGGLSYSQKVTVLGGTPQRPCGTTPLKKRPLVKAAIPTAAPPPLPPSPPSNPPLAPPAAPPVPAAPAAAPVPLTPHPQPPIVPPTFFSTPAQLSTPLVPIVPPPPPLVLQPTPPSGTSYVQEREEEEEEAVEHSSLAVAERLAGPARATATAPLPQTGGGRGGAPLYGISALALLAAVAAAGLHRPRPRRGTRPEVAYEATNRPRRQR